MEDLSRYMETRLLKIEAFIGYIELNKKGMKYYLHSGLARAADRGKRRCGGGLYAGPHQGRVEEHQGSGRVENCPKLRQLSIFLWIRVLPEC